MSFSFAGRLDGVVAVVVAVVVTVAVAVTGAADPDVLHDADIASKLVTVDGGKVSL